MSATATATALRTYQIDKSHSEVTFQVRHLVIFVTLFLLLLHFILLHTRYFYFDLLLFYCY